MDKLLIAYSTTDKHTQTICERIRRVVEEQGQSVTMMTVSDSMDMDLESFNKIVIGASIRYGKHRPQVHEFVRKNQHCLENRPSAFFSVNLVARKPEKGDPETNPYMQKFLQQVSWQPQTLAVFAGKIDYPRYGFWDGLIIRFIMWMTKGPTDPKTVVDFTDWHKVEEFGRRVSAM
jgi:menaquinone-dependent protoporphyrinogen oxidase